jgi:peptidoglycan/xylan/chitin deacetylase (PgdA/CDA1 family)
VVICYHQVAAEERARFARQMDHLLRWTTLVDASFVPRTGAGRDHQVMVTADDGWKSFYDHAVPELNRRDIPFVVFAVSNRLGEAIDGVEGDRLMTAAELRDVAQRATVGSHTANHLAMTALSPQDATAELIDSRRQLAALLGRTPALFCFPFSLFDPRVIALAREAGYRQVFTDIPQRAGPDEFICGRIRVDPSDWMIEFHLKVMGAYRWTVSAIALKQALRAALRSLHPARHRPRPVADSSGMVQPADPT